MATPPPGDLATQVGPREAFGDNLTRSSLGPHSPQGYTLFTSFVSLAFPVPVAMHSLEMAKRLPAIGILMR